jgi:predicted Rossmann-fold nucleotide-binding protein
VLTGDIVIALPGGAGTRSEIALAERYGRPLFRLDPRAEPPAFASLDRLLEAVAVHFARAPESRHRDA